MGNTWTVTVWTNRPRWHGDDDYREERYCGTQSLLRALWRFWQAKREGYGCVKLEWR